MTSDQLQQCFLEGAGIGQMEGDSVQLGYTSPRLAPAGVEAVMKQHAAEIDTLRARLPKGSVQELELFTVRGFTFVEYGALFDLGVREKDYPLHPAFRSLWITTETERRQTIYSLDRDSFDDYFTLLARCLSRFNQGLLTFFFTVLATGQVSA